MGASPPDVPAIVTTKMMKLHFYYRGLLWKINLHFLLLPPGRAGTHANMYIYIYICVYTYMYSIYHYKSIHWKPPEIHQPNFFKFIKGSISLWTETRPRTAVKTPMLLAWAQGSWTKTQKYVYIYIYVIAMVYGIVPICIRLLHLEIYNPTKKVTTCLQLQ